MSPSPRVGIPIHDARSTWSGDPRPPAGAPNVVAIVLDDTGFAQLGCFGSGIATPHIDRLASGGLRYNRFHVTSLCSPTRASFLTGRNHHAVGMGFLADIPMAFDGYNARIPKSAATLPRLLRDAGYSTMAVGKWHLTPRFQRSAAGPFDMWPLGLGFERYYGFLQGDANHWAPRLVCDNHYLEPPPGPNDGYHLSEDLAETAARFVVDQQQAAPGKPFFLYLAFGAMHAPHHVAPEWVEPYRGRFDQGWDAWRREIFARQMESGTVPPDTVLTERPPWVEAWDQLGRDERRMLAREQEVFAGFLAHTDAQIGTVLSALKDLGQLDNTLVLLFSDNGASAEGGRAGSVNEHRFTARIPESMADNLAAYDDWGSPRTYNHYGWGWAWAGNTPLRLWKRYTWLGGVRTPLIVHWPGHIPAGDVRGQLVHVIDLMPTVLDAVGITPPPSLDGVTQQPLDGASILTTFSDSDASDPRPTQYFEMLGSRAIISGRWKATTDHVSVGVLDEEELMVGSRDFAKDHWSLFDLTSDFSESTDVSATHPDLVEQLADLWLVEAARNKVMPIDDGLVARLGALVRPTYPPGNHRTFRPGASPVGDESVPWLWGGFLIAADVDVPEGIMPEGVLFALGDWNGGYALFVTGGRLTFALSRAGDVLEVTGEVPVRAGPQTLGVSYVPGEGSGTVTLLHDATTVGQHELGGGLPLVLQHGGAALRLGHDAGLPVSESYRPPAPWNGTLVRVVFETPGPVPLSTDEVRAALHHE